MARPIDRRRFLTRAAGAAGTLLLGGCDRLSRQPWWQGLLTEAEDVTHWVQRGLLPTRLAREYSLSDISPAFRANGSTDPDDPQYRRLAAGGFADWRLQVGGLVERPAQFSLADLRAMPARTQITRHDCVEGWSCIGQWTGVPLADLLRRVGLKTSARFAVFRCADTMAGAPYYESIGLDDILHPQTILAYDMNGGPLPIRHGAPLRLRVERQLGYKMAKYVMAVDLVDSFAGIGRGRGGYWEDRGYDWYAGI